ncbi:MAG: ABC transporter permease [Actinomycetia bacterium]|nr:ABC transporter permease [Actinomycetes bacterium]MCP5035450.1 ABC transporter permease [Actinomycetes bacterium]
MGWPQWLEALAIGLVFAPAAFGVFLTFRILDFPDLTVEATFPAGGAVAAVMTTNDVNPWLSLPAAMALAGIIGAVTGLLHIGLRINSLLASIITLTAVFTVNLRIQGSSNVSLLGVDRIFTPVTEPVRDRLDRWFGTAGIQIHRSVVTGLVTLVIVIVVLLVLWWFFNTEVGLALRATGSNIDMARSQAVNTELHLIAGVALSNSLVGLTGALFVQHAGFADVNAGGGLIVAGLASVIIGEVLYIRSGRTVVRGFVAAGLGMLTYRIAIAIALNADLRFPGTSGFRLEATDIKFATAAVVVAMLVVPRIREIRQQREWRKGLA